MLCERCSAVVKPIVAVDCDGVLAMYHEDFTVFCGNYFWQTHFYLTRPHQRPRWDGSGEFEDYLNLTKAEYREAKLAFRQGGGKRMLGFYADGINAAKVAKEAGAEVWITTTRPWNRFDSTDPDTRYWLDGYKVPYDHLLYDDDKYGRLAEIVDPFRVVAVLEDLPPQYERAQEVFGSQVPMLVRRDHNLYYTGNAQIQIGVSSAIELLKGRITRWNSGTFL